MAIEKDNINRVVHRLIELAKEKERIVPQCEIDEAWSSIEEDANVVFGIRHRRKIRYYYAAAAVAAAIVAVVLLFNSTIFVPGKADDLMEYMSTGEGNFTQLVTPTGSKNHVTFADGSEIWMNSGTKIVYPAKFSSDSREIYIEGEAYLKIAHNAEAPFTVHTREAKVRVLGTTFNVASYPGENHTEVVLVQGKVDVSNGGESHVVMSPGELAEVRNGELQQPVRVNVDSYICWIDDQLVFHNDPLAKVFGRLKSHYGVEFVLGPGVDSLKVTGKLNLKEDIDEVMRTISFTSSTTYSKTNGKIWVSVKE